MKDVRSHPSEQKKSLSKEVRTVKYSFSFFQSSFSRPCLVIPILWFSLFSGLSHSEEIVPFSELTDVQDLKSKKFTSVPYAGKVTGVENG